MMILLQTVAGMAGIAVVALLFASDPNPPPWPIYAGAAFAAALGVTWLHARWKYGRGISVRPSRHDD